MKREAVKYRIGEMIIEVGFKDFSQVALALGITPQYLSHVVRCKERPPRIQAQLAKLLHRKPQDLFAQWTHPSLKETA